MKGNLAVTVIIIKSIKLSKSPLNMYLYFEYRYIVSTESGNVLIWSVRARAVIFKAEQRNVIQMMLIDGHTKFVAVSRVSIL